MFVYFARVIFFTLLVITVGCETQKLPQKDTGANLSAEANDEGYDSKLDFKGISGITYVDDTIVTLAWNPIEDVKEYLVYQIDGDSSLVVKRVFATESGTSLTELESGKEYSFKVHAKDEFGLLDTNNEVVTVTTDSVPSAITYMALSGNFKNDVDTTPSFVIYGGNRGDIITLYSDACVTEVGSTTVGSSSLNYITASEISNGSYSFYSKRTNINGESSDCSSVSVSYNLSTCPDGFIEAPGNISKFSTADFCVMKYEARAWSDSDNDNLVEEVDLDGCNESACSTKNWGTTTYKPGSTYAGYPWRNLNIEMAKAECLSLGDGYDLISNAEWMTLATDIEAQNNNWSSGVVGTGCLFRGNNGLTDNCGYDNSGIENGLIRDYRSVHELSNGEFIYDFAGSVAEWVDWYQGDDSDLFGPNFCQSGWLEFSDEFCESKVDEVNYIYLNPASITSSSYNSDYGLGQIEGGNGGAALRGGDYYSGIYSGVFTLSFASSKATTSERIGFRCVYRPN